METLISIGSVILAIIVFSVMWALFQAIVDLITKFGMFLRKKIGKKGTWISGLTFLATIAITILISNIGILKEGAGVMGPILAVVLPVLIVTSLLIWVFSAIGASALKGYEQIEKLAANQDADGLITILCSKEYEKLGEGKQKAITSALVNMPTTSVAPLVEALNKTTAEANNIEPYKRVIKTLVQIGKPAVNALIADLPVNHAAAYILGALKDDAAVEPLINLYQCGNANARGASIHALGMIKGSRALEQINSALMDEDPKVRDEAAKALKANSN